jgi:hypothetical protein
VAAQDANLAPAGAAGALGGAGEVVPGAGKAGEAGSTAVSVRGEHRADTALAIGVAADDDRARGNAAQHALAGVARQQIDRGAQSRGVVSAAGHVARDSGWAPPTVAASGNRTGCFMRGER